MEGVRQHSSHRLWKVLESFHSGLRSQRAGKQPTTALGAGHCRKREIWKTSKNSGDSSDPICVRDLLRNFAKTPTTTDVIWASGTGCMRIWKFSVLVHRVLEEQTLIFAIELFAHTKHTSILQKRGFHTRVDIRAAAFRALALQSLRSLLALFRSHSSQVEEDNSDVTIDIRDATCPAWGTMSLQPHAVQLTGSQELCYLVWRALE